MARSRVMLRVAMIAPPPVARPAKPPAADGKSRAWRRAWSGCVAGRILRDFRRGLAWNKIVSLRVGASNAMRMPPRDWRSSRCRVASGPCNVLVLFLAFLPPLGAQEAGSPAVEAVRAEIRALQQRLDRQNRELDAGQRALRDQETKIAAGTRELTAIRADLDVRGPTGRAASRASRGCAGFAER